ncbi:hypothetical protein [Microbacterium sp. R86528]|uniref:hypothetical protein n=1 Tax=Microbacterium sp. R86528 TaxID=3093864 RepID=UPI0037CAC77E
MSPADLADRIAAALVPSPIPVTVRGVSAYLIPRRANSPEALARLRDSPAEWARRSLDRPLDLDVDDARDLLIEHSRDLLAEPKPLRVDLDGELVDVPHAMARSPRHLATLADGNVIAWARTVTGRRDLPAAHARRLAPSLAEAAEAEAATR